MLQFFEGNNFRISIFARDGIQSKKGVLYLPKSAVAPPGVSLPGRVIKHSADGLMEKLYTVYVKTADNFQESTNDSGRIKINSTLLGNNIYDEKLKRINLESNYRSRGDEMDDNRNDLSVNDSKLGRKDFNYDYYNLENNAIYTHSDSASSKLSKRNFLNFM